MDHRAKTHHTTSKRTICAAVIAVALLPAVASAACFKEAGSRFNISPVLIRAISQTESGGNPNARNRNQDGSVDVCHMQINSRWFPTLARHGIAPSDLDDPCTCTYVGAWILAGNVNRLGYNWRAVGAYNARSEHKRVLYAHKVAGTLARMGHQ
jgi:soluble lytic murein transglycosylase-like protein